MKPTEEQVEISDVSATLQPGEALRVAAFAGSGKTTTLKRVAMARSDRGLYLAFNKSIADEAKTKLAMTKCTASTMHSLTFRAGVSMGMFDRPESVNPKTFRESGIIATMNLPRIKGWNDFEIAGAVCRALSAFCASADGEFKKSHGRTALIAKTGDPEMMFDKIRKREAQGVIEMLAAPVAKMARRYWKQLVKDKLFSHDMYLKMADLNEAMRIQAFLGCRYLMVDEAQDLNPVQRSILEKTGLPLIAVGDSYQQIYAWRGAENALDLLPGQKLHLTQSFRFGENIAARAREILDTYPDGPPEKRLIGAGTGAKTGHKSATGAVICRTNIGMLEEAIRLMRRDVPIHVDNMGGLLEDVMSAAALKSGDLRKVRSDLIKPFGSWDEMEAEAGAGDATLSKLINIVERNMIDDVRKLDHTHIRNPEGAKTVICTAHRSKGLEFPVVKLGDDWNNITEMKARLAKSESQSTKQRTVAVGEWNALYVASTRAMNRLTGLDRIMNPEDLDADLEADKSSRAQPELDR